jgi:hypothetical protein
VIAYRAMLDVPRELVAMVAGLLRAERRARSTRRGSRALTCWYQALLVLVCVVRNCFQVGPDRSGAGSIPAAFKIFHTVDAAAGRPSPVSSPWMRSGKDWVLTRPRDLPCGGEFATVGFSRAICSTRARIGSCAHVTVEERAALLHLSIRDDGIGGADPARGSGLIGLRDRVQALGGSIEINSRPGEGTVGNGWTPWPSCVGPATGDEVGVPPQQGSG